MTMPYLTFEPRDSMDPIFALRTGMWCVNDKSVEVAQFLESFLRPGHRWLMRAWSRAAFACGKRHRYDEACAHYTKIMEALSKKGKAETVGHARVKSLMGYAFHQAGKLEKAAPLYESSLRIYERCLGKHHDILVAVLHNLSMILCEKGELERAETLNRQAMDIAGFSPSEVPNYSLGDGICSYDLEPVKTYPSWKGRSFTTASLYTQRALILRRMGRIDQADEWERHADSLSMRTMADW
jgi:tetratricopeptide (TPR) repeat protein